MGEPIQCIDMLVFDDEPFMPSLQIQDAWYVVKRLQELGWLVRIQEMPEGFSYRDNDSGDKVMTPRALCLIWNIAARESGQWSRVREIREFADTSPLAICRAALSMIEHTAVAEGGI